MIWVRHGTRRDLLDVLGMPRAMALPGCDRIAEVPERVDHNAELAMVWNRQPHGGDLPALILLRKSAPEDFLAWSTTYLVGHSPITAYSRVLDEAMISRISGVREFPDFGPLLPAWVGSVLGEAFEACPDAKSVARLPLKAYLSTLLFCAGRVSALHLDLWPGVIRRWEQLTALSRGSHRGHSHAASLVAIANVLGSLGRNHETSAVPGPATELAWAVLRGDLASITTLMERQVDRFEFRPLAEGSREVRVRELDRLIPEIERTAPESRPVLLGCALSLMSPGTLQYAGLALELRAWPATLAWYGLFAGLWPGTDVLSEIRAVGRRVARELERPELRMGPPRGDIAYEEFDVMMRVRHPSVHAMATGSELLVEVAPGCCVPVSLGAVGGEADQSQQELFVQERRPEPVSPAEAKALLTDLRRLEHRVARYLDLVEADDRHSRGGGRGGRRTR